MADSDAREEQDDLDSTPMFPSKANASGLFTEYGRRRRRRRCLSNFLVAFLIGGGFLWVLSGVLRPRWQLKTISESMLQEVLPPFESVRAHIAALSDGEIMQGRGPGTRGEDAAVEYIENAFRSAGCDHIERQEVPLAGVRTDENQTSMTLRGRTLKFREDYWVTSTMTSPRDTSTSVPFQAWSESNRNLLFGGYCIHDPSRQRTDFDHGRNVQGAVVVCLVGEPPALFRDQSTQERSYHARWIYKIEELRRRGARGVLLIHTDESAGYGWNVIQSNADTENVRLSTPKMASLQFWGWIRGTMLESQEVHVDALVEEATQEEFRVRTTNWDMTLNLAIRIRTFTGKNVIASMTPTAFLGLSEEERTNLPSILMNSHHDHLGVGSHGEIYYGALDNASGVAKMLAIAFAIGKLVRAKQCCNRKVIFASVTAEEAVLLGSQYLAERVHEYGKVLAVINFDGMNVWGLTKDVVAIGADRSSLGEAVAFLASSESQVISPDPNVESMLFFRSDQFSYARHGVPAVKLTSGLQYIAKDPAYADRVVGYYTKHVYHQPLDNISYIDAQEEPESGSMAEIRLAFRVMYALVQGTFLPTWKRGGDADLIPP